MTRSRLHALACRLATVQPLRPAGHVVTEIVLPDNGRGPPPGRYPLSDRAVLVITPSDATGCGPGGYPAPVRPPP